MKSCLLVIDAQESFRQRPYFTARDFGAYVDAQNALIQGALDQGMAVVRIFHVDGPETAANPFALASGHVRPLAELAPFEPDATFHKHRHSALVGTGLDVWLVQNQIGRLLVSGIRTEQCCETTTRVGCDMGYAIDFVSEATLTFPMTHPASGRIYSTEEIKAHSELVLAGRFARIVSVDDCLSGLGDDHA